MSALLALVAATATTAPTVELITMGPGDALYALWGHAALRIVDPERRRDVTFNFGSVDLSEGFLLRMLEGKVHAFVSVWPYRRTLAAYRAEQRTIVRRTLNLAPPVSRRIASSLDRIAATQRGAYLYHHFDNNCSTKVADALDAELGGALQAAHVRPASGTFREHALSRIRHRPLLYLAVDIVLTSPTDRPINAWQLAFLPEHLGHLLDTTELEGQPLVRDRSIDYERPPDRSETNAPWPWLLALIVFAAPVTGLTPFRRRTALALFAVPVGLLGTLLTLLEIGTEYDFMTRNLNLLVFPPTYLGIAGLALSRRGWAERIVAGHARFALAGWLAALALWWTGAITQDIGPMLLFSFGPVGTFAWHHR